jgi:hypothetical protein
VPFFTLGSDPHPPRESAGAGASFIFHPWVTRRYPKFQILMVSTWSAHLNFCQPRCFGLAQYYPPLKSRTITLGGVHLTHQLRSSLDFSIHRVIVIEFISTLLKPTGDPKPDGCERRCDFSPAGVATCRFGRVPWVWLREGFCQTRPVAIPRIVTTEGRGDLAATDQSATDRSPALQHWPPLRHIELSSINIISYQS